MKTKIIKKVNIDKNNKSETILKKNKSRIAKNIKK